MRPLSLLSAEDQAAYGMKEMNILTDFYGKKAQNGDVVSKPLVRKDVCMEEWSVAKKTVLQNMYPRDSTKRLYKLLFDFHRDAFPNLLVLAQLALIMPFQTADCERGFSCQNGIKTKGRSRLLKDNLNTLMTMTFEGGPTDQHDFSSAAARWKAEKNRRLFRK